MKENPTILLQRLRRRAAEEEDLEKLKEIASAILRIVKTKPTIPNSPWVAPMRDLRERMNLNQSQLATRLNCSPMSISRWERGLHEPPTRRLLEMGKLAGRSKCWAFWNLAGITMEDVREML